LSFAIAICSLFLGAFWSTVTPLPISIIGIIEITCGLKVLYNLFKKI